MSTSCGKDTSPEVLASSKQTGQQYQKEQEAKAESIIDVCLQSKATEQQAKIELVRQFAADPKGFQKAMQKIEDELKTGRQVASIGMRLRKGRTLTVNYKDGTRQEFEITGRITSQGGVIYDATIRDVLPTRGMTDISGDASNKYVGHSTNEYPDGYRASWDNPGQTSFHWTDHNVEDRSDPARHEPPDDAHKGNDPKSK